MESFLLYEEQIECEWQKGNSKNESWNDLILNI